MVKKRPPEKEYVVCTEDTGHEASLEVRKIYEVLSDREANAHGLLRVIDESGEDYLFPGRYFVPITLPSHVEVALKLAS
jgi:hypothetical protein